MMSSSWHITCECQHFRCNFIALLPFTFQYPFILHPLLPWPLSIFLLPSPFSFSLFPFLRPAFLSFSHLIPLFLPPPIPCKLTSRTHCLINAESKVVYSESRVGRREREEHWSNQYMDSSSPSKVALDESTCIDTYMLSANSLNYPIHELLPLDWLTNHFFFKNESMVLRTLHWSNHK